MSRTGVSTAGGCKWSRLLADTGLAKSWSGPDPLITSIVEDSRQVTPGACFVAMRGSKLDGHTFIDQAVKAGASAVVCERPLDLPPTVARLSLESARGMAGRLAAALYGIDVLQRRGALKVAGITGTNGKSTFCFLLRAILRRAGCPTALFGTIEYDLLARKIEASLTTPAASMLMSYLAETAGAGATHAVMEVSSIALDQGRCDGIRFDVGAFSNLTGDHLDYHGDMGAYFRAKKRLFDGLESSAVAVVNAEDVVSEEIVKGCRAPVLWYGIGDESRRSAGGQGLWAHLRECSADRTRFDLTLDGGDFGRGSEQIVSPLVGRHNVQNCLAAAAAAVGLGVPLPVVAEGLACVDIVPGRLQRVTPPPGVNPGFTVLVDYAHTDDALANVLSALRPLVRGRLMVLFGCGGDRDATKRPRMARVAAQWADRIFVTSDNPRTEDPARIIEDILRGFDADSRANTTVEPDRRKAIAAAIAEASAGDVVLLAGKGHEDYQIIGTEKLPFDDAVVAREAIAARRT